MVNQWNLSLQRQVGTRLAVDSELCRQHTIHLATGNEINPAVFLGLGACTINGVNYSTCSTTANTNARRVLIFKIRFKGSITEQFEGRWRDRQLPRAVSFRSETIESGHSILANYTWSHCISDTWNTNVGGR